MSEVDAVQAVLEIGGVIKFRVETDPISFRVRTSGYYQVEAVGSFNDSQLVLEVLGPDRITWLPVYGTYGAIALSADGYLQAIMRNGQYRLRVVGVSSISVDVLINYVGDITIGDHDTNSITFDTLTEAMMQGFYGVAPEFVVVNGYKFVGDGGHGRYQRQNSLQPLRGQQIVLNGAFNDDGAGWTFENGWTVQSGRLGPNSGGNKRAIPTQQELLQEWSTYEMSMTVTNGSNGSLDLYLTNTPTTGAPGYRQRRVATGVTATTSTFVFASLFEEQYFRILGASGWNGTIDNVSVTELTDGGQIMLFGVPYAPVPLNGELTLTSFKRYGDLNDDNAAIRMSRRIKELLALDAYNEINVNMRNSRYVFTKLNNTIGFAERKSAHFDMTGSVIDGTGWPNAGVNQFWLNNLGPGYRGIKTTMVGAHSRDALEITVADNTQFNIGDWIAITSTWEYWNGARDASGDDISGFSRVNKGELVQVRRKTGTDKLILGSGIYFTFNVHPTDAAANPVNIRKIGMAGKISITGGIVIGPGNGALDANEGPGFIYNAHFSQADEKFTRVENCQFASIRYVLCCEPTNDTPTTIGYRLDDASNNIATPSEWFYGREYYGCPNPQIYNPIGKYCRRSIDLHEVAGATFAYDAVGIETVITTNATIDGGRSDKCLTQPGGHQSAGTALLNHVAWDTGGQARGRDFFLHNYRSNRGFGFGMPWGTGFNTDPPSTYPDDDPSVGHVVASNVVIDNPTALDFGLNVRQSFDSFTLTNAKVKADRPLEFNGRHQSNLRVQGGTLEGLTGNYPVIAGYISGNTQAEADAAGNLPDKIDASHWVIKGVELKKGTYGITHAGCKVNTVSDIRIRDVEFVDIATAHVQFLRPTNSLWATDYTLELSNCSEKGTLPAAKTDFGTVVVDGADCRFGDRAVTVVPSGGVITVPSVSGNTIHLRVNLSAATAVDSISGVPFGKRVIVYLQTNAHTLTLNDGTGNLRLPGNQAIDNSQDRIELVSDGTNLLHIATANNT